VFYVGHLPAFAWNQVGRGVLDRTPFSPALDDLFQRGIDPSTDESGEAPEIRWPRLDQVHDYRDRVRDGIRDAVDDLEALDGRDVMTSRGRVLHAVIEHEAMHHETLLYMIHQLEGSRKRLPGRLPTPSFDAGATPREVLVPGGRVVLGADFDESPFGWDNEFPRREVDVAPFHLSTTPVMNGEFLEFVETGGYDDPRFWTTDDWRWRREAGLHHPVSWRRHGRDWICAGMFEDFPLVRVFDWPVYVSHAEAQAYAAWKGARLPTEAEFHRAAYGTPNGEVRRFPWGDDEPTAAHGNFDLRAWGPEPVGCRPDGVSAFGVHELVGNGWEWTSTVFAPFRGFEAYMPEYPGYSADFFDEDHYVMLGASWATPRRLVRRSFRNWFRPTYPYVFGKFRCARDAS